ncbi:sporozoite surface protein 3, putative [Plasmodium malariae]|uniref:Sporozoite surface protein 3, putative n=3 Tax=Plasmodium (Plasmodium) TaxID=418103 RepID=A0A1D3TEK5_PLAMA|nr:sporozoite surface protein 3, putative [Plasmodium malariae]SCP03382.1 sporozoite surface protein 3, putative [Plasmodium malariae]
MSTKLCYIFFLFVYLCTPVKNEGYMCDFSSEKYSLDMGDYYDDVICYHEIGEGDSIGMIIPRYRDGNENIHIITKCFDKISLKKSGANPVSIYEVFTNDEISLSDANIFYNSEYLSSILHIKKVSKSNYIHCAFESRNAKGVPVHRGMTKISIKNTVINNENKSNRKVIDLFNKIDLNKDNSKNKYSISAEPGHILYILGIKMTNNKFIYFDDNCPIDFEQIGDIYKYIFPLINEKEVTYDCPMYLDENGKNISVGLLHITFVQKNPTLVDISKEILKMYMKYDIEKNLIKLLYGTEQEDNKLNGSRYIQQSIDINETQTSNLQSMNLDKEHCNNDKCNELFDNSHCSSICGNGYRLHSKYNVHYDTQGVVPCNNGECSIYDEIEPLIIFSFMAIVIFCITVVIFIIMLYNIMHTDKRKISDPFFTYDSNIKNKETS